MNDFLNITKPIKSRSDIARLLGLRPNARRRDIASAFGRATRCEAWMQIEEEEVLSYGSETWEVRIVRSNPRCQVFLRPGARGEWISSFNDIPVEVASALEARPNRSGGIETTRSWKVCEKLNWLRNGRRLKGKKDELHILMEIDNVGRPTGETRSAVLIEALAAPCPEDISPVRLDLPISARDIGAAVVRLRSLCDAQLAAAS